MKSKPLMVTLKDGRSLAFQEYGAPNGKPVFYFHGVPGSRFQRVPDENIAKSCEARIIVPDRPGIGLSTFKPRRQLLDWPLDVAELADSLGFHKFAVVGVSGGAPYAAACAYRIPERLTSVGLVSPLGPSVSWDALLHMHWHHRIMFFTARWCPPAASVLISLIEREVRTRWNASMERFAGRLCPMDQEILRRSEVRAVFREDWLEAVHQGNRGIVYDIGVLASQWKFSLNKIKVDLWLWHGEADGVISVRSARSLARKIPHCKATFLPDEGHFLVIDRLRDILSVVLR